MYGNTLHNSVDIPLDIYQSATEMLLLMPLGGVFKESVQIKLLGNTLTILGKRVCPVLREKYMMIQDQCFWGSFEKKVELPESIYFDKIYSELSSDNILTVVVPKIIAPETVAVVIR